MRKKTIKDIDVSNKRALVRVDFNVPLSSKDPTSEITVTDDTRLKASLPTLNYLLERGASLILCSHLGRPSSAEDRQYAMDPVARRLSELLGRPVKKLDEVVGEAARKTAAALEPGEVVLLENTRFHPGEKKNDPELARQLADLADLYVNDAFGSAHRAHASTEGVAQMMRAKGGPAVAGLLMEKELSALSVAVDNPPRPYISILGGAKISDKIGLVENLLEQADTILIGGGMANTFLKAKGLEVGKSLVENDVLPEAKRLMDKAGPERLVLPVDVVIAEGTDEEAACENVPVGEVPPNQMIVDIGLVTVQHFSAQIQKARLVVWNGPMGIFEIERFASGTNLLATLLASQVGQGTQVIVGGGDSAAAINKAGLAERMTHVSTGGGASLAFLEGKALPGIVELDEKE